MVRGAPVNVIDYISGGSGTNGDPYVGWDTAITWAANTEYVFPVGVFGYSTSLELAFPGIIVRGSGVGTVLKFTGTGACVRFDRGGLSKVYDVEMSDILIKGNANATYGVYLFNVAHIKFSNVNVVDVTLFGMDLNDCVLGLVTNFTCSVNQNISTFLPATGLRMGSPTDYSAAITIVNPIIEGVSGTGIWFDQCIFSKVIGGTSEANSVGVRISANAGYISLDSIDCEANSSQDYIVSGGDTLFTNAISGSPVATSIYIDGNNTRFLGGQAYSVQNVGTRTEFHGFKLIGGSFTDTGTNTIIENLYDTTIAAYIAKKEHQSNLVYNGSMEAWSAGTSVAPDGWTLTGAGATIAREATTIKHGTYSAAITRSGADAFLTQGSLFNEAGLVYLKGRTVTFSAWVWASVANVTRLSMSAGTLAAQSIFHSGNSTWQLLSVTLSIPANATGFAPIVEVTTTNTTVYVDAVTLAYGGVAIPYDARPIEAANAVGGTGSAGAGNQYVSAVINGVTYKLLHDN